MKKLILTIAVAAFAFSPMISQAAGHGAEQLVIHQAKGGDTGKAAQKHKHKKHKKHHKKHHKHKRHHKH